MNWLNELQLASAIALTTFAKFLMTDEGPVDGETEAQASLRKRRALGGIISGMVLAYYGHDAVLRYIGLDPVKDQIIVAIVLAMTGEHMARWIIKHVPEILNKLTKLGPPK